MESLAYTLIFLLKGRLPWQGFEVRTPFPAACLNQNACHPLKSLVGVVQKLSWYTAGTASSRLLRCSGAWWASYSSLQP